LRIGAGIPFMVQGTPDSSLAPKAVAFGQNKGPAGSHSVALINRRLLRPDRSRTRTRSRLYHASLDAAEYRELTAVNGFELVRHTVEDPQCGGHTVWLAQAA
jgi:hypothetical protein